MDAELNRGACAVTASTGPRTFVSLRKKLVRQLVTGKMLFVCSRLVSVERKRLQFSMRIGSLERRLE
jgi:hypothetical protein